MSTDIEQAKRDLIESMDRLSDTIDKLHRTKEMTPTRKRIALDGLAEVRRLLESAENSFYSRENK